MKVGDVTIHFQVFVPRGGFEPPTPVSKTGEHANFSTQVDEKREARREM